MGWVRGGLLFPIRLLCMLGVFFRCLIWPRLHNHVSSPGTLHRDQLYSPDLCDDAAWALLCLRLSGKSIITQEIECKLETLFGGHRYRADPPVYELFRHSSPGVSLGARGPCSTWQGVCIELIPGPVLGGDRLEGMLLK